MVLGQALDQDHFGLALGAVFAFEIHDDLIVFLGVFPGQEDEHASSIGKAVA